MVRLRKGMISFLNFIQQSWIGLSLSCLGSFFFCRVFWCPVLVLPLSAALVTTRRSAFALHNFCGLPTNVTSSYSNYTLSN